MNILYIKPNLRLNSSVMIISTNHYI